MASIFTKSCGALWGETFPTKSRSGPPSAALAARSRRSRFASAPDRTVISISNGATAVQAKPASMSSPSLKLEAARASRHWGPMRRNCSRPSPAS